MIKRYKPSTLFIAGVILGVGAVLLAAFLVITRSSGQSSIMSLNTLEQLGQINTSLIRVPPHTDPFSLKGGFNPALGITSETIWFLGGRRPQPDFGVALPMSLRSTNVGDTLLGAGAQQVNVDCLDTEYFPFHEIIDMGGMNLVPMTEPCHKIQGAQVVLAGSNEAQLGDITIENSATVYDIIPVDPAVNGVEGGTTQTAVWTVPANRIAPLGAFFFTTANDVAFELQIHKPPAGKSAFFLTVSGQQQVMLGAFGIGCYEAGTTFEFLASKETGTASAGILFERLPIDSVSGQCPSAESRLVVAP